MIFGGLEFLLFGFLFGAAVGVIIELVIIAVEAIIEVVNDWLSGKNKTYIVNPDVIEDEGLRRKIRSESGTHKRIVVNFNPTTEKWEDVRLVKSDEIDPELEDEDVVEIVTR